MYDTSHRYPYSLSLPTSMAPPTLSLISCLFLMSSIVGIGGSIFDHHDSGHITTNDNNKVALDLYYESLCPYSANFIVNLLPPIFQNGFMDIVDLTLYPWGNAKFTDNNSFTCQHGPAECLLNTIEACAISVWPSLSKHFPFIYCVEKLAFERKYTQWETCFGELGLDPTPVNDCYRSGYGNELELKYGNLTGSLQPPHKYVPWVVVDGQPLYEDYENFTRYVCKAYKGSSPDVCSGITFGKAPETKTHDVHPVCYNEDEATVKIMPFMTSIGSFIKSWVLGMMDRAMM